MSSFQIADYQRMMINQKASDLLFSPGTPLHIKIEGQWRPLSPEPLSSDSVEALANSIMSDRQRSDFDERPELNLGLWFENKGRFRVNLFRQRGLVAIAMRYLPATIPDVAELKLPDILEQIAMRSRGLVLMVGATGAGKSTSLAAMIDYRNAHSRSHILTVEEPIEYVYSYRHSVINQREVGIDTLNYADALKNALREAPDVIMIGEIRDRDTMQHAISYAETGHLCLATLHATNANTALQRAVTFFPEVMRKAVLADLSSNLSAIVSQRLVRGINGKRVPAVEVLLASPLIQDLIHKDQIEQVREAMEKSTEEGMQSFDQSLFTLYRRGLISKDDAMANADSATNLNVRIKLAPA